MITEREEKASIAAASNTPFSEWSSTFTDPRLAAAVVDRLTYRAHIIDTGTNSDRPRAAHAAKNRSTTGLNQNDQARWGENKRARWARSS